MYLLVLAIAALAAAPGATVSQAGSSLDFYLMLVKYPPGCPEALSTAYNRILGSDWSYGNVRPSSGSPQAHAGAPENRHAVVVDLSPS